MTRNVVIGLISLISVSSTASAAHKDFNKKQYNLIKDIIWAADKVEVPRELLLALCFGENSFRTDNNPTHMDGKSLSYGQCQMKLSTALHMDKVYKHKVLATSERLENTKVNAFYAAKYLKLQLKKYDGNWQLAVDAYNKGHAVNSESQYVKRFHKNVKLLNSKLSHIIGVAK